MAVAFLLGALTFYAGDWFVDRQGGAERKNLSEGQEAGSGAAIFIGTLLDNIPESLILGMGIALGVAVNLAFLVAVSAACAGLGYLTISLLPAVDGHIARAFAAGAMLTIIADAMMPEAFEHGGRLVGIFTVFGFVVAAVLSVL
jgi:ZIP family zinc transporter